MADPDDELVSLVGGAPHFLALLTPAGVVLEASEAGCREAGLRRDRLIRRPIWDGGPWAGNASLGAEMRARVRAAVAGHRSGTFPVEVPGPNGVRSLEVRLVPYRRGGGPVVHLVAEAWDVTDHLRAARRTARALEAERRNAAGAAAREARARVLRRAVGLAASAASAQELHAALCRILVEESVAALAFVAAEEAGRLVPIAAAGLGAELVLAPAVPMPSDAGAAGTPDGSEPTGGGLFDRLPGPAPVAIVADLRRPGEAAAWLPRLEPAGLRSVASVTFGADDRPAGRLAIAETRRGVFGSEDADLLRALADLVELRLGAPAADDERSRRIVEATQDGVWIIDGSGRTSEASPRLGELLDRPSAELVGRPALELVDPDDRRALRSLLADPPVDPGPPVELRLLGPDGAIRWCRLSVVALRREVPADGALALVADVTEHRRREQELERIEQLRRRLLDRAVRAQEAERARIAREVHEGSIQVLAGVGMLAELLVERAGDPAGRGRLGELAGAVRDSIARLRVLLLDLHPADLEGQGLGTALRRLARERERLGSPRIEVLDELTERPATANATILYRVAQDAVANAIRHARARTIRIVLRAAAGGIALSVVDDGVGFDPATLVRRPDALGVAGMRDRAELAGGRLAVTSAPGRGTTVEAWVPDLASDAEGGSRGGPAAVDPTAAADAALAALGVELPPGLDELLGEGAA